MTTPLSVVSAQVKKSVLCPNAIGISTDAQVFRHRIQVTAFPSITAYGPEMEA